MTKAVTSGEQYQWLHTAGEISFTETAGPGHKIHKQTVAIRPRGIILHSFFSVLSKVSSFQGNILSHEKKQESVTHPQEIQQVTETTSQEAQMSDFADKISKQL